MVETLARKDDLNFQVLTENSVDLLCRVGLDYTMHYVSPACFRILGWTQEGMIGVGPEAFILAGCFSCARKTDPANGIVSNKPHTILRLKILFMVSAPSHPAPGSTICPTLLASECWCARPAR